MRIRSDASLVRAARGGDERAAAELARRYMHGSWRAAYAISGRAHLADDAVQDAFERVLRSLDRFEDGRPFGPWLHRIVVNCTLTLLARAERDGALDEAAHWPAVHSPADRVPETAGLIEALGRLSVERRTVVILRLLLGYSPEETAGLLGVAEGTVHSRLSRALVELRSALEVPGGA